MWQGCCIDTKKPLSIHVTRAILADMNEVEWRWELINLDSKLYGATTMPNDTSLDDATVGLSEPIAPSIRYAREQRRLEVLQSITHFDGLYVPRESFYKKSQGFAARQNSERVKALLELVMVMDQWVGEWRISGNVLRDVKGLALARAEELDGSTMTSVVDKAERRVASHYINAFKAVFSRAPTLPRETRTWAVK